MSGEIRRRLPELELIEDELLQAHTEVTLAQHIPDYFWTAPAASTYKHHNPLCCGTHGLWIHTKMVFSALERFAPSFRIRNLISLQEWDYARAAVLLHDIRKYGDEYEEGEYAKDDHDINAATLIREETDLPEPVAAAIESHMGPWYAGSEPSNMMEELVHLSDMAASTKDMTV